MRYAILLVALAMLGIWTDVDAKVPLETWISTFYRARNIGIQSKIHDISVEPRSGNDLVQPRNVSNVIQPRNDDGDDDDDDMVIRPMDRALLACGDYELQAGQTVFVQSQNYPQPYPRNHQCSWGFQVAEETSTIRVSCTVFKLKKSKNCKHASVSFRDEDGLIDKVCGKNNGIEISSIGNSLEMAFKSGKKKPNKGFRCVVTASEPASTTTTTTTTDPNGGSDCVSCGTVNRANRIVGGVETEVNEYPWQVALVYAGTNSVFCGGSIYNELYVITAAHCGEAIIYYGIDVEVLLGAHNVDTQSPTPQRIAMEYVVNHPDYDSGTLDNDIAILKLASRATLNDQVKPACLPDASKDYSGYNAIVSGWGVTSEGGSQPSELLEVEVPVVTNAECSESYGSSITDNMVCAGLPQGGRDACQGDSGGPMAVEDNGKWVLIGVVSWGYGCARPDYPGVYARVTPYLSWLQSMTIDGGSLCTDGGSVGPTTTTTTTTQAPEETDCIDCGTVNRANRIVGGVETEVNEYPWQVALVYAGTNSVFCGGSIYNEFFVITAAHCGEAIINYGINTEVLLGAHNVDTQSPGPQRIAMDYVLNHPNYNNNNLDNDIALLKLVSRATLSNVVKPACLPDTSKDYSGFDAIVSGWGVTEEGGSQPSELLEVEVPVLTNAECSQSYGSSITDNMICAGLPQGGKDACQGDSGGPMAVEDNGKWVLIGVVSWGYGCARPDYPGVYARVTPYNDWIRTNTQEGGSVCSGGSSSGQTTTQSPSSDCTCGRVNSQSRIVGGEETLVNEYPWQVALVGYGSSQPYCGASVISDRWILTAAHCLPGVTSSNVQVIMGEHNWGTTSETNEQRIDIEQVVMHPSYDSSNFNNDIGLIKTQTPIVFPEDNSVAPICLPVAGTTELFENVDAIVTGWGTLSSGGNQPYELHEVTVPTMPNADCAVSYGSYITGNMICAGLDEGGKDSCQGDSGGPMVTGADGGDHMLQIGVVSFGYGCAFAGYPGVYARVSNYVPWITNYISDSTVCSP